MTPGQSLQRALAERDRFSGQRNEAVALLEQALFLYLDGDSIDGLPEEQASWAAEARGFLRRLRGLA